MHVCSVHTCHVCILYVCMMYSYCTYYTPLSSNTRANSLLPFFPFLNPLPLLPSESRRFRPPHRAMPPQCLPFRTLEDPHNKQQRASPPQRKPAWFLCCDHAGSRTIFCAHCAHCARARQGKFPPLPEQNHPTTQPPETATTRRRQPPTAPAPVGHIFSLEACDTVPKRSTSNSAPPKPSLPWRAAR